MIKITVVAQDNRRYVSIDLPGFGKSENDHNVGKALEQTDEVVNFSGFNGTQEEWDLIIDNTKSVIITQIGAQ